MHQNRRARHSGAEKKKTGGPTSVSGGRDAVLEKCETHGAGGHGPRRNSGQVPDPSLLHRLRGSGSGGRQIISRGSARLPRTSFPLGGGTRSDRTWGRAAAAAAAAVFLPAGAAVHPPGERRRGDGGENPALSRCGANTLCHSILSPPHHPNPAENGLILADGLSAEGRRAVAPT